MIFVSSSYFNSLATSEPSIPGIMTSNKITLGEGKGDFMHFSRPPRRYGPISISPRNPEETESIPLNVLTSTESILLFSKHPNTFLDLEKNYFPI